MDVLESGFYHQYPEAGVPINFPSGADTHNVIYVIKASNGIVIQFVLGAYGNVFYRLNWGSHNNWYKI